MTGKKLIFSGAFLLLFCISLYSQTAKTQAPSGLEAKAVAYFCHNVIRIKKNLTDYNIRFKGNTTGKSSDVYKVADCLGDISLIKDSISNKVELDNLAALNDLNENRIINTVQPNGCSFLKKKVFAPFNKRIYTLKIFNAIKYKERYFVELYLSNKNLNTWIICIEFNKNGEPLSHCTSSIIY